MDLFQEDLKRHYEQGMADREAQIVLLLKRNAANAPTEAYQKAFTQLLADLANDGAQFEEDN
jgi:hypothetical protein